MVKLHTTEPFERELSCWGGRGGPYLWQEMTGQLMDAFRPTPTTTLERLFGETFEYPNDHPLEYDTLIHLAYHAHGGMSSGMVSPEF